MKSPAKSAAQKAELAPDKRIITKIQAERLASLAKIDAKELIGHSIADLAEKLKWRIDPELFFFRRICGRVVKKDPVTGVDYPVPFATVEVQDTDCGLVAYFPPNWRWGWFYPFHCRREVLATVKTDECGRFCVYIPRFDIDWILRWRRHRVCLPDIFIRPSIKDLVAIPELDLPVPPRPGPLQELPGLKRHIAATLGGVHSVIAEHLQSPSTIGREMLSEEFESARAFPTEMQAPVPLEFQKMLSGDDDIVGKKPADPNEAIRASVAKQLGVHHREIEGFDLNRFIGPFHRCFDIYLPHWQLLLDVPDITFRVTQDTDGDGIEEVIYSEGYFDVRWNSGPIPSVTLVASDKARESRVCDTPNVPCKDVPEILFAGLMPLDNASYFNAVSGYAVRPNRPIPPSGPRPLARTPFLGTVQLYGCVNVPKAQFYRVLASTDNGTTFNAITGLSWNIYPIPSGAPHLVTPDADGWYPVLSNPAAFHPANLVLEWPTPMLAKTLLKIEVGGAAKNHLQFSGVVAIQSDNTAPTVHFDTLAWKFASEGDSAFGLPGRNLLVPCPTIRRGAVPQDVDIRFVASVTAHHLRDAALTSHGCGGGSFSLLTSPADTSHWHETTSDNTALLSGTYRLAAGALEGSYGLGCVARSRAMNPSGGDGGHLVPPDWNYDPVYVRVHPEVDIAVINA
jgi:hypothetical protein